MLGPDPGGRFGRHAPLQYSTVRPASRSCGRQAGQSWPQGLAGPGAGAKPSTSTQQELDERVRVRAAFPQRQRPQPLVHGPGAGRARHASLRRVRSTAARRAGPYAIDKVIQEPGWDTIDMVKHDAGPRRLGGPGHLYSSKPPLLPTLLAGEYWLIHQAAPARRSATQPYRRRPLHAGDDQRRRRW